MQTARKSNTIELNGKLYDALTGELMADSAPAHSARVADVVKAPAKPHHPATPKPVAHHAPTKTTSKKQVMDIVRPGGKHLKHHQQQHSHTLMRYAVKKPADSFKRHAKAQTRTDILAKVPTFEVVPKLSISSIDAERLKRAKRIAQSRLIHRFAPIQPVRLTPVAAAHTAPAPAVSVPAPTPTHHAVHPAKSGTSMDIFERALAHANAHEQPAVHPKKHLAKKTTKSRHHRTARRLVNSSAAVLALLLIIGFIGYQNKANIMMRVASAHAGFHAELPGYQPSGFAVGKFSYSPGTVAVNFQSNTDNRHYSVTQKASNWDSETLLNNYVANANEQYQTYQSGGRTIYIYGNNDATWVSGGVWYQVSGNGALSTNQLLQLAQSM